ncbi:MAG: hypothetical protein ACP5JG_14665 [Anaerolineae bacterium]
MKNEDRLRPYIQNPTYWQYKQQPVLLAGGSKTDHIFLLDDLKDHLDDIHAVGGNCVRNTMSQREARSLKPYLLREDGQFDLESWNADYWQRFQSLLRWTAERDIVVQIEVWDRFDYSRDNWDHSPWNPGNNVNYTYEETGFSPTYPLHPSADVHPFFHTIPSMSQYRPHYDLVRGHQERFAEKLLSYSLPYGHVLYCMNNETSTDPAWGRYWIRFIAARAADAGVTVYTTDMFDDAWRGQDSVHFPVVLHDPEVYTFVDVSQVNSRNFHEIHWTRLRWLLEQVSRRPRPANNTKVYGGNHSMWGSGGNAHGVHRFWRDLIGGCAGARFHRPPSGNGLNERAKASLQAVRKLETQVKLWDVAPQMDLLVDRAHEVYVTARPGVAYVLYFVDSAESVSAELDLAPHPVPFTLRWLSIDKGEWGSEMSDIEGGEVVQLAPPDRGNWLGVLVKA